jgi:hypothetical protein
MLSSILEDMEGLSSDLMLSSILKDMYSLSSELMLLELFDIVPWPKLLDIKKGKPLASLFL